MTTNMIPAIFGSAGEFDIDAMERAAYQRGDDLLADLLGRIIDMEEISTSSTTEAEEAAERADRLCENIDDACSQIDGLMDDAPDGCITKEQFAEFLKRLEAVRKFLEAAKDREAS